MQPKDSRGRPLKPCRGCGGTKPPGKGHGYCETCKALRKQVCKRCGSPKEPQAGPGVKLCAECRSGKRERALERKRVAMREWRVANPDKAQLANERVRAWREANPEKFRGAIAAWEARNRDAVDATRRRSRVKRRMREQEAFVEDVEPLVVLEYADGICGVCGCDVDPLGFDVDHIVPLSKGGEHSYSNTQPAHPSCNRSKGAKVP